jgi:hypothetical protein
MVGSPPPVINAIHIAGYVLTPLFSCIYAGYQWLLAQGHIRKRDGWRIA